MVQTGFDALITLFAIDVDALYRHHKVDGMLSVLSEDEQARAERYQFAQLRDRFISGRFFLRTVLAEFTDVRADLIRFEAGNNGKPAIDPSQCPEVHFSFSRSAQYSACCFSRDGRVGIDLELKNEMADMDSVASEIFTAQELIDWQSLSASEKQLAFYRVWTRKEAVAKVGGRGISQGLTEIKVPMGKLDQAPAFIVDNSIANSDVDSAFSSSILLSDWQPFADVTSSVAIEVPSVEAAAALELGFNDVASHSYLRDTSFRVDSVQRFISASTKE